MSPPSVIVDDARAAARLARFLPSFRDFVEAALFAPGWGYYASGEVRFGDGGDYDTFPIALSPFFGEIVARLAFRRWRAAGSPRRFEICEVGAGNGQLCNDVLIHLILQAERSQSWRAFSRSARYRIIEKSPALRERQAAVLGPLATRVVWEDVDLCGNVRRGKRAAHALVIANEVLDCLSHHKAVRGADGTWRVAFVGASASDQTPRAPESPLLNRRQLFARLARGDGLPPFAEYLLPVATVPEVEAFLSRHWPGKLRLTRPRPWTYFACPDTERFLRGLGQLYAYADIALIDYGGPYRYHLRAEPEARLRAGRPEEGASPYRAPGRDDITFLVDFTATMEAARACGLKPLVFGSQGELAHLAGVRLGSSAVERIVQRRALSWLLAAVGVGPESAQRRSALTWRMPKGKRSRPRLAAEAQRAIDEFLGRRSSPFQLLWLRRDG